MAGLPAATIGWLGDGSSFYPDSKAPLVWDLESGVNVKWRTDLGTRSSSGVIVVGDKLFTQADPYYLVCLDRDSGKELWRQSTSMLDLLSSDERKPYDELLLKAAATYDEGRKSPNFPRKELGVLKNVGIKLDGRNEWIYATTFTRATPVSDGKVVVVRNQCGGFACFTLDGKKVWEKPIVGLSSSPIIVDDKVVVAHRGLSQGRPPGLRNSPVRLGAFDLKTGKHLWNCPIAYRGDVVHGTVQVMRLVSGRTLLITSAGAVIDLKDGKEVLSLLGPDVKKPGVKKPGNYSGHTVLGSPAIHGNIVILQPEITDEEIAAQKQGKKKKGSLGYSAFAGFRIVEQGTDVVATKLWRVANVDSYDVNYCSAIVMNSKAIFQTKNGHLRIFDPETGSCDFRKSPDGDMRKPQPYIPRVGHGMWVAPSANANGIYVFTHQGHWATYDHDFKKQGSGKINKMGGTPGFGPQSVSMLFG